MNLILTFLTRNWERLGLERFGAPSRLSCVMATPRFRASSHTIFFVLADGKPAPIFVAKVPRLPGHTARLDREAANLRAVQSIRNAGFDSIPRLVAYEDYGDSRLLIETALHGQPMNPALVRQQTGACLSTTIKWLLDLHTATAQRGANFGLQFERLVERPLNQFKKLLSPTAEEERLIEQTLELTGALRDHELPLVCEHGDFSHPNILLVATDRVGVVDWELAESDGLPVMDLFFFLTYIAFARQEARQNNEYLEAFHQAFLGPAPWAWSHVFPYCRRLKLSVDMLAPLFVLCWSRYVIGLAMRLHEGEASGEKLDFATMQWLRANRYYALWRHAVTQLQPQRKTFKIENIQFSIHNPDRPEPKITTKAPRHEVNQFFLSVFVSWWFKILLFCNDCICKRLISPIGRKSKCHA